MTSSCSSTTGAGAVKWCFLALLLLRQHVHVQSAKSYGGLCSPADRPVTCLFKGLLKSAMIYASRRNEIASDGNQLQQSSKGIEQYLVEQIRNLLGLFSFGFQLPVEVTAPWSLLKSSFFNGRGKKNKNLGPMLAAGAAVMAGTLMPLAFGALFMLAGKAIMTSLMAITISGLLGLKALFSKHESSGHVKSYSAMPPPPHYSEAQFEQDLGIYKGQSEAKMHSSVGANFYAAGGDSNLSSYYKGEQHGVGSNQPEYFVAGAGPKFDDNSEQGESKNDLVEKND